MALDHSRYASTLMCNVEFLQKHKGVSDPLEVVAGEISDEAILLCVDEFMVQWLSHHFPQKVKRKSLCLVTLIFILIFVFFVLFR